MLSGPSFVTGMVLGFVLAGVFGWALTRRRANKVKMDAPFKPMTIVLKTEKTPAQVFAEAARAQLLFFFWTAVLIFTAYAAVRLLLDM